MMTYNPSRRALFAGLATLALALGLFVPGGAWAQRQGQKKKKLDEAATTGGVLIQSSPKFLAAFRDAVAGPAQSTVRVRCDGKDTALGVAVTEDGFILTKHSDLTGKITVRLRDGEELDATLVGAHTGHDLAMLKVEAS